MVQIGRNDPCPCGSGKKFKKCHMGREEELVLDHMEHLPDGAAKTIASLPPVEYGNSTDFIKRVDIQKLTGKNVGIRFIDLGGYLELGYVKRENMPDLTKVSAGQMINPLKTADADMENIYVALSPAVSDSTLVHQMAHVLDYLVGSKNNPGLAHPLSMETELPLELLEHPREFGEWLAFLTNELGVTLDAEDTIVAYLYEKGQLLPGDLIASRDHEAIILRGKSILEFMHHHREEIDREIRSRTGYIGKDEEK